MIQNKIALSKEDQEVVDTLALISVAAEETAKQIIRNSLRKSKEGRKNGTRLHNR